MARRRLQRIASVAVVALAAAALAVPAITVACGNGAGDCHCCCKSRSAEPARDCHQPDTSPTGCVSKSCPCCRPAVPQNIPPANTLLQLSATTTVADVPWFHGGTELSTELAGLEPTNLAAIPHRILHCSWLI